MKPTLRTIVRVALVVGAIGGGVGIFAGLVASKPQPQRKEHRKDGLVVDVRRVSMDDVPISVTGHGVVIPAEQVDLQAEVVGKVVWQSDRLIAGGRFRKGDTLLRLDSRDYRLSARELAARVERAEVALDIERGRKKIAEREWELLDAGKLADADGRARALREPQLRAAQNDLRAARAGQERAQLAVAKTVLRAPFNAVVVREAVGKGQLLSPGFPLASLVNTDTFLVQVAIPADRLSSILVPGLNAPVGAGAPAVVRHDLGTDVVERRGRVVRLLSDLDPNGQMARVVVEVEDPLGLARNDDGRTPLPLLLGAQVQVEIDAGTLERVVEVPRAALRNGDEVFVMDDGSLDIRPVHVVWRTDDSVFVNSGLKGGEELVVSRVAAPLEGMRLVTEATSLRNSTEKLATTTPSTEGNDLR